MAIQIRKKLSATPNPTSLPKRIELTQTLRSNRDAENIQVTYELDAAHNVWFDDGNGNAVKSVERAETVGRTDQVCVDRILTKLGPGNGPMATVEIRQTITDGSGINSGDMTILRLTS